jgi:hypothetical protein
MGIAKSDVVSRLSLWEQRKHPEPTYFIVLLQTPGTFHTPTESPRVQGRQRSGGIEGGFQSARVRRETVEAAHRLGAAHLAKPCTEEILCRDRGGTHQGLRGTPGEESSRVVDQRSGMITRRLPDPALVARSAPLPEYRTGPDEADLVGQIDQTGS